MLFLIEFFYWNIIGCYIELSDILNQIMCDFESNDVFFEYNYVFFEYNYVIF